MSIGLMNTLTTFQRTLDILLSKFDWRTCLVYLDDVILFSKSIDAHLQDVYMVLSTLRAAGVSLNLKKHCFFIDSVNT